MRVEYRWTDGNDRDFRSFYKKTEAYYNSLVSGQKNREAFIPYNLSETIPVVIIASVQGKAVGCAGLKAYSEKDAEIKRVWVEPEYRGNRIAGEMMDRIEGKAKDLGFRRTILQTRPAMKDAVRMYLKRGYRQIENYPPYDRLDGAVCFARDLPEAETENLRRAPAEMVRLEKVNGKNVWDLLKLHVSEGQESFVAPNDVSMIEAYVAITHHGQAFPFGIYDGDTPVGFCMIGFGTDDEWEDAPAVAEGNYNLWRFMIDERYQGRGYGKTAMKLILNFIAGEPCGPAEYCWLSYELENSAAKALYASFGFQETGEKDGDEVIAVLKLNQGGSAG